MENIGTVAGSLFFFFFFLSIGAMLFSIKEGIGFFDAFYFCFITMTTIGFGDIVPTFENGKNTISYIIKLNSFTRLKFLHAAINSVYSHWDDGVHSDH